MVVIHLRKPRGSEIMDIADNRPRYFDDDGGEINPDLLAKPSLCVSCKKDEDQNEEILCNINRFDQQDEADFKCGAYESK